MLCIFDSISFCSYLFFLLALNIVENILLLTLGIKNLKMPSNNDFDIFREMFEPKDTMLPKDIEFNTNLNSQTIGNFPVKANILIVDDDVNIREALKFVLEKKYEVILCANGLEALQKMDLSLSAIILDIKMEGKNGFETFTEIKKKKLYVPIIFHSAYQDLKDPYEILNDFRPFGYIIKEGDSKKLIDTIDSAVHYYRQISRNEMLVNELEKSEKKYKDLVENSLDIIFSLDSNWRILSINQSVTNILRYPIKEIQNQSILELAYKSNLAYGEVLSEKLQEIMISKDMVSFNCDLVTKFGEPKEMHIKLRYVPLKNSFVIFGTASNLEEDILIRICETETQVYKLGNFLTHVDIVSQRLANYAAKYCNSDNFINLKLCVRELLINAMEHGNLGISFEEKTESLANGTYIKMLIERQKDPTISNRKITLEYSLSKEKFEATITDEGNGFDYQKMLARSMNDNNNQILDHGRGIALAKMYLDKLIYNEKGNSVYMLKNFN